MIRIDPTELEGCGMVGAEKRNESEACPDCKTPTMLERHFIRFATNEIFATLKCEDCGALYEV